MKRIISLLFSVSIYFLSQQVSFAQPYCDVRTFSMRDGLSANVISDMGQDTNGLMWFSTYNGLCCYDGYRFITFRGTEGIDQLTSNRIFKIKPEGKVGIWVITYDRRLYFFDTATCKYTDISSEVQKKTGQLFLARNIYTNEGYFHTWILGHKTTTCLRINTKPTPNVDSLEVLTSNESPLIQQKIRKVWSDEVGNEWVFTDRGIALYGTKLTQDGPFEHITKIADNTYIAQTNGSLWRYIKGQSSLKRISLSSSPSKINCIKEGPNHQLLIGTENGVMALDIKTGASQYIASAVGNVTNVNVDHKNRIWAYTESGSIVLIHKDNNTLPHNAWQFRQFSSAMSPIATHLTTSAQSIWVEDRQGTIWMAPKNHALCYYDEADAQPHPYALRSRGYDYTIPFIKKSFIDRQHNIWLSSTQFLTLANPKYHDIKIRTLQAGQETRALMAMPDGTTWAGTDDGIIGVYDAKGQLSGYVDANGRIGSSPTKIARKVSALYRDSKGRIYIGTRNDGLFIIDNGKKTRYVHDNDAYSLSSDEIYAFDEDEQGNLWVATYGGGPNLIKRQENGAIRFIHAGNEMKQYPLSTFNNIRRITHDGKGAVILSSTSGIVTFSNRFTQPSAIRFFTTVYHHGDTTSLRTCDVLQTLITSKGDIYVTTMGGCVQQLTSSNLLLNDLRFKTIKQKIARGNVLSLIEDRNGNVWGIHEASLYMFDPKKDIVTEYGPNKLGDHIGFTEAQPVLDPQSGRLIIPTMGGVIMLQPDELRTNDYKPEIVFTSVRFQGEAPQPLLNMPVLDIPSDKRNFTLTFAALDYQDNDLVRYAYKIEGIDKDWNYVGSDHQAQLSHIPAGRHRFIVKSTNSDGVWTDNETTLEIYVHPTFWETIWGKLLIALLVIIVVSFIIHVILLRHRARMLREINKMKIQFFTDVSHKLRTPLTLIEGPVSEALNEKNLSQDVRQHLEMVKRNAQRMLVLVNKMLKYSKQRGVYITEAETDDISSPVTDIPQQEGTKPNVDEGAPKLLIVEDDNDLRAFLFSILSNKYNVIVAENGKIGLEKATSEQPDFIITDVTMPEMDGLTMVQQIKQNQDICHIPIVVLSAKASLEDRLQGLKEGIDDYITKPFSATYLRQRIENIIAQRQLLQRTWLGQLGGAENTALETTPLTGSEKTTMEAPHREYRLEAPEIVDTDQEMMEKLMKFLEANISEQDLKIEDMADAVNLGRTVFYGKIKSIVGMAPFDFLRHIRMQRAEDLISRSQMNISEVAYAVGFTDPKYFTKCFKKETGMTPTEYRDKKGVTTSYENENQNENDL